MSTSGAPPIPPHPSRTSQLLGRVASRPLWTLLVYLLLGSILAIQVYSIAQHQAAGDCPVDGNYRLFVNSFDRLLAHQNLYANDYPGQCYGYKYTPTFALAFGLFGLIPEWLGLVLWLCLPLWLLHHALYRLPNLDHRQKLVITLLLLLEMVGNLRSQQSNVLLLAILLLAYVDLESGKSVRAALLVVIGMFIKVYAGVAALLFIFYPSKLRLAAFTFLWVIVLGLLPLVVVTPSQLLQVYTDWLDRLAGDAAMYAGNSIHGFIEASTGFGESKSMLILVSSLCMGAAFLQVNKWNDPTFRSLSLAALLLWMIAFNPKAESPTYIIAMAGAIYWLLARPREAWRIIVFACLILAGSLMHTDLVPRNIRREYIDPYALKGLRFALLWLASVLELWMYKPVAEPLSWRQAWSGITTRQPTSHYRLW